VDVNPENDTWVDRDAEVHALLAAVATGGPSATRRLLAIYRPYLLAVAERELESGLRPKAGASDLVQQTLFEACESLPRFDPGSAPAANLARWLRQLLRNNLADFRRKFWDTEKRDVRRERGLDHSEAQQLFSQLFVSESETPSGALAAQEETEVLKSALSRLPREYEAVLRGLLFDGFNYDDMAQRLGRSTDAVRGLCIRAIKRLRREIADPR
jgi:RNA polymerase sigma-70 factor, ECF subfamily